MGAEVAKKGEISPPPRLFRDIRRYYCEFCGICRSKKSLINAHILSQHQDESRDVSFDTEEEKPSSYACEECGAAFRKPAYLRQHMQSHSIEDGGPPVKIHQQSLIHARLYHKRPFNCPVDDCHHSYRRKDHLTRHLLQHQGNIFMCPKEGCNSRFSIRSNLQRHIKDLHDEESPVEIHSKKHICPEIGCGKEFKYLSRLKKHEESHVKLEYVEVICGEPGCMKYFTNAECLKAHIKSCHQHVQCPTCGTKQLRKNIKRHLCIHEDGRSSEKIKCYFPRCLHTFSKKSNLAKHVKAVHLELRPFSCRIPGCGLKFPYKHVRDNHERSGVHTYAQGDFLEVDELFRSKPRGGRKRKALVMESLLRKRIAASPNEIDILQDGTRRLRQILGDGLEDDSD